MMNDNSGVKTHYVKRAVIMAAGIGKRLQPLTCDIPKPLIKVNGVRMIDTIISALHRNGIDEIYVVIGYQKDKFYEWVKGYDKVMLIENPYFSDCNNISSAYVARQYISDSIILDGDQIIYNPDVLNPGFTKSGYNAVWCEGETKEWLLNVKEGVITSCSRTGGSHGWQLYSVSRWTKEDGERLKSHIEYEFESGNRNIYWDDVAMYYHFDEYTLGICEMKASDIIEIDSLEELGIIDKKYLSYLSE